MTKIALRLIIKGRFLNQTNFALTIEKNMI